MRNPHKHRGYYYTEANFKLPAISIKERKIEDSLPEKTMMDMGEDNARFTVFPASNTLIGPGIWEKVAEAIRLSKKIRVLYRAPGSEPATREIAPYHGVRFEGDWYVVAYCHLRKDIRTFSVGCAE